MHGILIGSLHSRGPGGSILSNNENISKNPKILKENYIFKGFLLMVEGRLAVIEMEPDRIGNSWPGPSVHLQNLNNFPIFKKNP